MIRDPEDREILEGLREALMRRDPWGDPLPPEQAQALADRFDRLGREPPRRHTLDPSDDQ